LGKKGKVRGATRSGKEREQSKRRGEVLPRGGEENILGSLRPEGDGTGRSREISLRARQRGETSICGVSTRSKIPEKGGSIECLRGEESLKRVNAGKKADLDKL